MTVTHNMKTATEPYPCMMRGCETNPRLEWHKVCPSCLAKLPGSLVAKLDVTWSSQERIKMIVNHSWKLKTL